MLFAGVTLKFGMLKEVATVAPPLWSLSLLNSRYVAVVDDYFWDFLLNWPVELEAEAVFVLVPKGWTSLWLSGH